MDSFGRIIPQKEPSDVLEIGSRSRGAATDEGDTKSSRQQPERDGNRNSNFRDGRDRTQSQPPPVEQGWAGGVGGGWEGVSGGYDGDFPSNRRSGGGGYRDSFEGRNSGRNSGPTRSGEGSGDLRRDDAGRGGGYRGGRGMRENGRDEPGGLGRGRFDDRNHPHFNGPPGGRDYPPAGGARVGGQRWDQDRDRERSLNMSHRGNHRGGPGLSHPAPPSAPMPPSHIIKPASELPLASVHLHIESLKSFKNFMLAQADDLTAEAYQRRYEDYHLKYVEDFSDTFFRVSKGEEWFKERYNPLKMKEQEEENCEWAAKESALLLSTLLENPSAVITSMSLDPSGQLTPNPAGRLTFRPPPPFPPSISKPNTTDRELLAIDDKKVDEKEVVEDSADVIVVDELKVGVETEGDGNEVKVGKTEVPEVETVVDNENLMAIVVTDKEEEEGVVVAAVPDHGKRRRSVKMRCS